MDPLETLIFLAEGYYYSDENTHELWEHREALTGWLAKGGFWPDSDTWPEEPDVCTLAFGYALWLEQSHGGQGCERYKALCALQPTQNLDSVEGAQDVANWLESLDD